MKLFEIKNTFDDAKFEKDCAFYLKQMGSKAKSAFLYRGTDSENIKLKAINPFRPRTRPLEMPKHVHDELNSFFQEKFGHPYRNALFAAGDVYTAEMYGSLRVIVPVGEFDWLCSKEFGDLWQELIIDVDDDNDEEEIEEHVPEFLEKVKTSKKWLNSVNLPACAKTGSEVMLWCPQGFYTFDPKDLPQAMRSK